MAWYWWLVFGAIGLLLIEIFSHGGSGAGGSINSRESADNEGGNYASGTGTTCSGCGMEMNCSSKENNTSCPFLELINSQNRTD